MRSGVAPFSLHPLPPVQRNHLLVSHNILPQYLSLSLYLSPDASNINPLLRSALTLSVAALSQPLPQSLRGCCTFPVIAAFSQLLLQSSRCSDTFPLLLYFLLLRSLPCEHSGEDRFSSCRSAAAL